MAMLLPALLALGGLAAGSGAGLYLRPAAEPEAGGHGDAAHGAGGGGEAAAPDAHAAEGGDRHGGDGHGGDGHAAGAGEDLPQDYVKLSNQFVIPVLEDGRVAALVILSLSLEVTPGLTEQVYQLEPKLRDAFLQVMFDHANAGGFRGTFTDGSNMILLREALREVAARVIGPDVTDVLIIDIVRQDN